MWTAPRKGRTWMAGVCVSVLAGCSPYGLVDSSDATTNMLDPESIRNQQGVVALYNNTVLTLANVMAGSVKTTTGADNGDAASFVRWTGHASDELEYRTSTTATATYDYLDISTRNFYPDYSATKYDLFNRISDLRILAAQTQTGIRMYGARLSDTVMAHAMAIEASAMMMTAELYCSGVPLSTMAYNGDISLSRGYSTDEVYAFALAKLDSAASLAVTNARIVGFINLLRVRILLGTGKIQEAAAIAQRVETPFQYLLFYDKVADTNANGSVARYHGKFTIANARNFSNLDPGERIGDRKGTNGFPYVSSNDPRINLPAMNDPWAPLVMASGVEARLAEAEAALQRDDPSWLGILNALRTSCVTVETCSTPAPAGTGGIAGLGLLQDPGDSTSRVTRLFEERAYWLFLRGFRQGDLRRRMRTYGGSVQDLYPNGLPAVGNVAYGYMVSLPVPAVEQRYNPHYKGCLHNDA